ncbi:hypothetical protein [Mycolicibacterium wolinskyi]|uniref:hypothetical protein n=1 Tax=Mycolicibacterium wolinskyi TaxID=59750 RepID=UPI00391788BA
MSRSTEATPAEREFASDVLRNLLRRIDSENQKHEQQTVLVSHAWTEGAVFYVVYDAPPSDITWGLTRDTRESIVDLGPWTDLDEAVLYYYLLDFEENWPGRFSRQPGEPDVIRWSGDLSEDLVEHPSDIPDGYRHSPSAGDTAVESEPPGQGPVTNEPRQYGDPL